MPLQKRDKEFRLPKISYLDFKHTEMDRVLTVLFSRIQHQGYTSRLWKGKPTTIADFREHFLQKKKLFRDFDKYPDVFTRWLETHLLDLVNRGKQEEEAVAAPRPLHGLTYRFRNPKHCRDYGASRQIYEMLKYGRSGKGLNTLQRLKAFFFAGVDNVTDRVDDTALIDVETQALLGLTASDVQSDAPDTKNEEASYPPLCIGAADLMADDVTRLLIYKDFIPRSVMVDYLKILLSFHLALYHLRVMKMLPILVKKAEGDFICGHGRCPMDPQNGDAPQGDCPYQIALLVDVAGIPGTHVSDLATRSADFHYRRIPPFLKGYFVTRKLDEFSKHLKTINRIPQVDLPLGEVLELQKPEWKKERDIFFGQRRVALLETEEDDSIRDPQLETIYQLGLDDFNLYMECVYLLASNVPRRNLVNALDSLLLKNRPGALLAQGRAKGGQRRFILDSRLLEVLLQIAVLRTGGERGYHTAEIRIEEILSFIRERYGVYVDRLPDGEGFEHPSIADRESLRGNTEAFKSKLREIGFYQDLSDAYITQHVTPRYVIKSEGAIQKAKARFS
ncbi:MAG: hypothetical protein A2156_08525 [Deltaproteobacteria bacterium RBG_16_48_10]|nr:MAG: hypothetical protein A2156_08525 [Deltaproteobacteria bacterium RBG_16_48_10]